MTADIIHLHLRRVERRLARPAEERYAELQAYAAKSLDDTSGLRSTDKLAHLFGGARIPTTYLHVPGARPLELRVW